jgi:hypothetical protein
MQRSSKLAAIFSPTRRLLGAEGAPVRAGGPLGGLQFVVPRADCQYRRMDFSNLPPRQRAAAARIAARRFDPRPGALVHVAWTGPIAHAWTWVGAEPAILADEASWIPETLLRAAPAGDGLRLLRQSRGVEGQYWHDGRLQASQWWGAPPAPEAWQRFARACGLGPETAASVPEPLDAGWSDPWGDAPRGLPASPAILERWAWTTVLVLVACALGWQVAAHARWSMAQSRLDARLDALRSRAAPLLAARERADTAREALLALRELQQGTSDYRLMAEVMAPLPEDAKLASWVRDGAKLQATVQSADTDPRHFVAAYDGQPRLSGVIATPDPRGMVLAFDLDGADAATTAAAPTGAAQ